MKGIGTNYLLFLSHLQLKLNQETTRNLGNLTLGYNPGDSIAFGSHCVAISHYVLADIDHGVTNWAMLKHEMLYCCSLIIDTAK